MTDHSPLHKRWIRSRKGYSGLIATIFMVLVVMYLYFNVFMFIQSRNVAFQDTISQSQQLDVDRNTEQITISNATMVNAQPNISCTITNTGPLPVQIVRLWVQDLEVKMHTTISISPPIVLQPGSRTTQSFPINIAGASVNDPFCLWFVTARGNLVSTNIN